MQQRRAQSCSIIYTESRGLAVLHLATTSTRLFIEYIPKIMVSPSMNVATASICFFKFKLNVVILPVMHAATANTEVFYNMQGVPNSTNKNYILTCSLLQFTAFEFILIQYICKFCLVYYLINLNSSRQFFRDVCVLKRSNSKNSY